MIEGSKYVHAFVVNNTFRFLCGAAFLLTAVGPARAALKQWVSGAGNWSNAANWSPVGVPGPLDSAAIGNLAFVENEVVNLNQPDEIAGLIVANGMTLDTNSHLLEVYGSTWISGQNNFEDEIHRSTLRVEPNASFVDFYTESLLVNAGGQLELVDDSGVLVNETVTIGPGSYLVGHGIIQSDSATTTFVNDGRIEARPGGLAFFQPNDGKMDLDGASEGGAVRVDTRDGSEFQIFGTSLADSFSGQLEIFNGSVLRMGLEEGWTADAQSVIYGRGLPWVGPAPPARIAGFAATLAGSVNVDGGNGYLRFENPVDIQPSFQAVVGPGGRLEFAGDSTIRGGAFDVGENGLLFFTDDMTWSGTVDIDGDAQHDATATVSQSTTINAGLFDWSGFGDSTDWNINAGLTINADSVRSSPDDAFGGELNISGGLGSRVTLNLAPGESWTMSGDLTFGGVAPAFITRLAGAPMRVTGTINVGNTNVDIASDVSFLPTATTSFDFAASDLRLRGATTVYPEAEFTGHGLLHNGAEGHMRLHNGASTDEVGLVNAGILELGAVTLPGSASVDRFVNEEEGKLRIKIGGTTPVSQYDRLLVTGELTELNGMLELYLAGSGGNLFVPSPENVFTIIVSDTNIDGAFDQIPSTSVGGLTVEWELADAFIQLLAVRMATLSGVLGDYNYNGVVDAADYTVWRDTFGQIGLGLATDGNGSGAIDDGDFLVWKANFGAVALAGAGGNSAVPEPTLLGAVAAMLPFLALRWPNTRA